MNLKELHLFTEIDPYLYKKKRCIHKEEYQFYISKRYNQSKRCNPRLNRFYLTAMFSILWVCSCGPNEKNIRALFFGLFSIINIIVQKIDRGLGGGLNVINSGSKGCMIHEVLRLFEGCIGLCFRLSFLVFDPFVILLIIMHQG